MTGTPADVAEKVDHLLGPRQAAEVPVNDDAVEAVVYQYKQAAKQLGERLHRSSSRSRFVNMIIGQTAGGVKISNMFG
jgi:glycerol-3-phosphate dehydrogenase